METSASQLLNALVPIVFRPEGKLTVERFEQELKAQFPMLVTPLLTTTETIDVLRVSHGVPVEVL